MKNRNKKKKKNKLEQMVYLKLRFQKIKVLIKIFKSQKKCKKNTLKILNYLENLFCQGVKNNLKQGQAHKMNTQHQVKDYYLTNSYSKRNFQEGYQTKGQQKLNLLLLKCSITQTYSSLRLNMQVKSTKINHPK